MVRKRSLATAIFALFFVLVIFFIPAVCMAEHKPLAFPEAVRFGTYTAGGHGGKVMFITNLNIHNSTNNMRMGGWSGYAASFDVRNNVLYCSFNLSYSWSGWGIAKII